MGAGLWFLSYVVRIGAWGLGANTDTLPGVIVESAINYHAVIKNDLYGVFQTITFLVFWFVFK